MNKIIEKNPLSSCFILAFILMWSLASLAVFRILKISDFPFLYVIGAWTPTIAAIFITFYIYGKKSSTNLIKGWLIYKVSIWYYICAFLPIILIFLVGFTYNIISGNRTIIIDPRISILSIIELLIFNILLGPTGEEAGWRGFALRFLQKKYKALTASVILGFIWSVWHLPMWLMPDRPEAQVPFWLYIIDTVTTSIFLTWIFNSTKGSLLLVGILHLSQNITIDIIGIFNLMPIKTGYISIVTIDVMLALMILIFWGKKNLSVINQVERKYPI